MNKKIILPLTVLSFGLVSCNNWKTINEEQATKIAENIVNKRKELDEYQKTLKIVENQNTNSKIKKDDKTTESKKVSNSTLELDLENNYYKYYSKNKAEGTEHDSDSEYYEYFVIKDNKGYYLKNDIKAGKKTKSERSTTIIQSTIKALLLTKNYYSKYGPASDIFSNFKKTLENLKTEIETQKKGGFTFTYSFCSNGDTNLGLVKNYSGSGEVQPGISGNAEENRTDKYENGLIKSSKNTVKMSGTDLSGNQNDESTYTYNGKITMDSINLDEYKTE